AALGAVASCARAAASAKPAGGGPVDDVHRAAGHGKHLPIEGAREAAQSQGIERCELAVGDGALGCEHRDVVQMTEGMRVGGVDPEPNNVVFGRKLDAISLPTNDQARRMNDEPGA